MTRRQMRRLGVVLPLMLTLSVLAGVEPSGANQSCRLIKGNGTPDVSDDVSVCREDAWLHDGGQKISNLAAVGLGEHASWNRIPPSGSIQEGDGAVAVMVTKKFGGLGVDPADTTFVTEGTFTGNIDNLAATFYLTAVGGSTSIGCSGWPTAVWLWIDGRNVADTAFCAQLRHHRYWTSLASEPRVFSLRFAFTNMYDALGLSNDPTKEHTVRLEVGGDDFTQGVFSFDSREDPAAIVFNLEESSLEKYKI